MSSTELVRSRVLTTTETDEERRAFTGTFGKVAGKAFGDAIEGHLPTHVFNAFKE